MAFGSYLIEVLPLALLPPNFLWHSIFDLESCSHFVGQFENLVGICVDFQLSIF